MRIARVTAKSDFTLVVVAEDGREGVFDLSPYFEYPIFAELKDPEEFKKVSNGGYFIEWENGADLSADTIEAHLKEFVH